MGQFQAWIGREKRQTDQVTPTAVARFLATVGSGDDQVQNIAPMGFHWCLCLPDAPMQSLAEDGHPVRGKFLPPIKYPRRMWAASAVKFLAPIACDAAIERVSTITSIKHKHGKSGNLVFVEIDHVTLADDVVAVTERQTVVYRDGPSAALDYPESKEIALDDWPVSRTITPTPALLFRYSALTFNSHRIHYDLGYAREREGYPALIIQGPLTATLLLGLAVNHWGADAIRQFTFRASAPAFVGETLHLVAREADDKLVLAAIGSDGRTVMEACAMSFTAAV